MSISTRFSAVPVGLAAAPAPLHPPTVVAAPAALVAPDTADVEVAEPQVPERPQLPTQDVCVSDSFDESLPNHYSQYFRIVSETPYGIDPVEKS